jgi:hypothetical protein
MVAGADTAMELNRHIELSNSRYFERIPAISSFSSRQIAILPLF